MEKTKATYMDVDSPIPYANNPRLNDNAADAVAANTEFVWELSERERGIVAGLGKNGDE